MEQVRKEENRITQKQHIIYNTTHYRHHENIDEINRITDT